MESRMPPEADNRDERKAVVAATEPTLEGTFHASQMLALGSSRPPATRNRLPLYLRKQTFSWPSLISSRPTTVMVALRTQAPRTLDRAGLCCPSDHMPSSREITIRQGLLIPCQPDKRQIATYRFGLWGQICAGMPILLFVSSRGTFWALRVHIVKS